MDASLVNQLHPAVVYVIFHAVQALTAFIQPNSYLYWPYSVSTLLLAWWAVRRGQVIGSYRFFSRALWWHPSALQDYVMYFLNFLIAPALLTALWINEGAVLQSLDTWLGGNEQPSVWADTWWARTIVTLCIFVAYDWGRFLSHWLLHHVPFLWEIHKVHHSAVVMTPMTSYRLHPLEIVIMSALPTLFTGLTTWLFNHFLGAGISVYLLLGLHVLLALTSLIDNLRHSPVWITYGALNRWLISPAHHQLHHSAELRHRDCNLGFSLAVWDRLAGSLVVPSAKPDIFKLGLNEEADASGQVLAYRHWWLLYWQPMQDAARVIFRSR